MQQCIYLSCAPMMLTLPFVTVHRSRQRVIYGALSVIQYLDDDRLTPVPYVLLSLCVCVQEREREKREKR